eukprot:13310390-Alexandrium_andersonii.AAC.1
MNDFSTGPGSSNAPSSVCCVIVRAGATSDDEAGQRARRKHFSRAGVSRSRERRLGGPAKGVSIEPN